MNILLIIGSKVGKRGYIPCFLIFNVRAIHELPLREQAQGPAPTFRLPPPADSDGYGIFGTDLRAIAAVDAFGRPLSPALAV